MVLEEDSTVDEPMPVEGTPPDEVEVRVRPRTANAEAQRTFQQQAEAHRRTLQRLRDMPTRGT